MEIVIALVGVFLVIWWNVLGERKTHDRMSSGLGYDAEQNAKRREYSEIAGSYKRTGKSPGKLVSTSRAADRNRSKVRRWLRRSDDSS